MPASWIYDSYDANKLQTMLSMQRELSRTEQQRRLFIVMDDCMYDKKIMKSVSMRDLFMNGRHLHVTLMSAVQYLMDIGPDLRTQVDFVFALKENIHTNRVKLWKYFFGMFDRYDDFCRVMEKCTQDHGALVLDNTGTSSNVTDCVFWYKADPNPPHFQMGANIFHTLDSKFACDAKTIEQRRIAELKDQVPICNRITSVVKHTEDGQPLID